MEFFCKLCEKKYKSYQSLWNHNNKFHQELNIQIINDNKNNPYKCSYCNMSFTRNNSMKNHMINRCKRKLTIIEENNKLKKEMEILKQQMVSKTSTTNNTTNNINNGIINNIIYINKTGSENYLELNEKETTEIFSKEISGVVSLIKYINFNERLPSNHSFCSKSLEGKYLLTFNSDEEKIESTRKKYFYHELVSNAVTKMELLYKKFKRKFNKDKQTRIEETLARLNDIKERDFNDKILREIKNQLIQLSYNCRNTVLNTWDNNKLMAQINNDIGSQFIEHDSTESESSDSDSESDKPDLSVLIKGKVKI